MQLSQLKCQVVYYRTRAIEDCESPLQSLLVTALIVVDEDRYVALLYKGKGRLPELKPLLKIVGKHAVVGTAVKWAGPEITNDHQRKFATKKAMQALGRWTERDSQNMLRRSEGYYDESGKRYFDEKIFVG